MRTTVNLDEDVLQAAKAIAEARGVSLGKALSDLARRGATALEPMVQRNGFYLFPVDDSCPRFGPDEVRAALEADDQKYTPFFVKTKS